VSHNVNTRLQTLRQVFEALNGARNNLEFTRWLQARRSTSLVQHVLAVWNASNGNAAFDEWLKGEILMAANPGRSAGELGV
jgi:hypothetical protein